MTVSSKGATSTRPPASPPVVPIAAPPRQKPSNGNGQAKSTSAGPINSIPAVQVQTVPDAEVLALSCLLQSPRAREECATLTPQHFVDTSSALVYKCIRDVHESGLHVDGLTVLDRLSDVAGREKAAAHASFLSQVAELVPNPDASYKQHIAKVRRSAGLRSIRAACVQAADQSLLPGSEVDALIDMLEGRLGVARSTAGAGNHGIVGVSIADHASISVPPAEMMLDPILETQQGAMVFGPRGAGKTWVSLGIACAIATGKTLFGKWTVPKPRVVVYIDGEMGWNSVSKRAVQMLGGMDIGSIEEARNLHIVADQLQPNGVPSLLDPAGQARIDAYLEEVGAELVIVDNLSALAGGRDENDAAALDPLLNWMKGQKRKGRTYLIVHHAGKDATRGGRGSSRLEDAPEMIMSVTRPKGWKASDGAIMNLEFTKGRHLHGKAVDGMQVSIDVDPTGRVVADVGVNGELRDKRIFELRDEGYSQREIAEEVGCGLGTVSRILKSGDR